LIHWTEERPALRPSEPYDNAGIWSRLTQFKKNLLTAQAYYDYFRYFNYTHADYFIHHSLFYAKECFEELKKAIDKNEFTQTIVQSDIEQLFAIIVEDEKYFDKIAEDNDKLYIKKSLTVRKLIKYLLPYGFVRLIQKIKKQKKAPPPPPDNYRYFQFCTIRRFRYYKYFGRIFCLFGS